jgi:hypothetical protein
MKTTIHDSGGNAGPKQRPKPYDHNVNEPAKLIDEEPAGIEHDVPAKPNEPVERPAEPDAPGPPLFEE